MRVDINQYLSGRCHLFAYLLSKSLKTNVTILFDDEAYDENYEIINESCLVHAYVKKGDLVCDINGWQEDSIDSCFPVNSPRVETMNSEDFHALFIKREWGDFNIGEKDKLKPIIKEMTGLTETSIEDQSSVREWMSCEKIHFTKSIISISLILKQINEMESTYEEFTEDKLRTKIIYEKIMNGESLEPLYIEESDLSYFVMEGRHRMVAMKMAKINDIPVMLCRKYSFNRSY
jgi:hypothetical protein